MPRTSRAVARHAELAEQVHAYQVREAEAFASTVLAAGSDLWAFDIDLSQVLDEHGMVNETLVLQASTALASQRKHLARRVIPAGDTGARGGQPESRPVGWSDLLRG